MCKPTKKSPQSRSLRKFTMNLSEPVSTGTKIKHIATNLWIRASKLQGCCGHPGQAGC
jgi:hypothetical protein